MKVMKSVLSRRVIFSDPSLRTKIFSEFSDVTFYSDLTSLLKKTGVRLSEIKTIHITLVFKRKGYYCLRVTVTDKNDRKGYKSMAVGEYKKTFVEKFLDWLLP